MGILYYISSDKNGGDEAPKTRHRDKASKELREQEKMQKEVCESNNNACMHALCNPPTLFCIVQLQKQLKAEMDSKVKSDPNNWGSHFRDRVLRALTMFGFGRWDRIKVESKCQNSDVTQVESFCR